jgi:saccharopine dehydrogenase-like NADP-dependent oxidoreductase
MAREVAIVGAGKIGSTIAGLLSQSQDYRLTIIDRDERLVHEAGTGCEARMQVLDIAGNEPALVAALEGKFAVLSAAPYHLTGTIANAARAARVHYLDLTEDVASTRHVRRLAADADTAFIPQCGLAPGFVSIVANRLAQNFEVLDSLRLRVGALPQFPSNALGYNLTWSTDGIINEYCEACEAIVDAKRREVPPLEEREELSIDGVAYEAFNTSGGLGTLCDTYLGRVKELNYRSIRYPGHAAIMKALLHDLRLRDRRDLLKQIFEQALPATLQDVVVVFVSVTGWQGGRFVQETYARKYYGSEVNGLPRSAIQLTTAAGICAMVDLLASGAIADRGFVRQEEVTLETFLANRFGKIYGGRRADA